MYDTILKLNELNKNDKEYPLNSYIYVNKIKNYFQIIIIDEISNNSNKNNDNDDITTTKEKIIKLLLEITDNLSCFDIKLLIYHKLLKQFKELYNDSDNDFIDKDFIFFIIDSFFNCIISSSSSSTTIFNHYHFYSTINKLFQLLLINENNYNTTTFISFYFKINEFLINNSNSINKVIQDCINNQFNNEIIITTQYNKDYSFYSILNKILKINLNIFQIYNIIITEQKTIIQQQYRVTMTQYIENLIILVINNPTLNNIICIQETVISSIIDSFDIPSLFIHSNNGGSILLCKIYYIVIQVLKFIPTLENQHIIKLIENNFSKSIDNKEIIYKLGYTFFNQDDIAINTMNSLLQVYIQQQQLNNTPTTTTTFQFIELFNPNRLFHFFIKRICYYDHLTLVDMLISNETNFLIYFLGYLKYNITSCSDDSNEIKDDNKFIQCLQNCYDTIYTSSSNNSFPYNAKVLLSRLCKTIEKFNTHSTPTRVISNNNK